MGRFVKGDIVVVPFPFSDLTTAKRRPALVIGTTPDNDYILCQITSQAKRDQLAVELGADALEADGLKKVSNVRPNKIFTADEKILLYKLDSVKPDIYDEIIQKVVEIIQRG